jgi:protein-S-isoprenylcysteine O-methyltransferase Ste14
MAGIWIRALVYAMFVGGGWIVILPAAILFAEHGSWWPELRPLPVASTGGVLFFLGLCLALWAGFCLVQYGHGTPLPLDPPRQLVTCGPYRHVRNPQSVAMVLMVTGQLIAIRSSILWVLLPLTIAYLELLVGPWEDRQMVRDFGAEYQSYARHVRKWLPLLRTSVCPEPAAAERYDLPDDREGLGQQNPAKSPP